MNRRVHLLLILLTMIILLFCSLLFFLYTVDLVVKQTQERGFSDIRQIREDISEALPGTADYQAIVLNQAGIIPAHIIIVDTDSNLLADSHRRKGEISGKFINAVIIDAKKEDFAGSTLRSHRTGELSVSVAKKEALSGGGIIISLDYRINEMKRLYLAFSLLGIVLTLLLLCLVFLIVSYAQRKYQKPIKKLLQHTKDAVRGGFSKITINSSSQELAQLVENFNSLVDRYNHLIESDNKKYSRINTLLSNLKTGILMVDTQNVITLVNPMAEALLNLNKLKLFKVRSDKTYRNEILGQILKETERSNAEKETRSLTITTPGGQILDITVEAMVNKYHPHEHSGALVILRDVTEMRRLERLKDEFVSNVSHELRTPLTVISGFVETLKSWELLNGEDRTTALNIIDVETERLKKLISELLHLSRIEGEMGHGVKRTIHATATVREVVSVLNPLGERKGITTEVIITEPLAPLHGMEGWFRQIVYNIYDNAIKYTPPEGSIRISLTDEGGSLVLAVSDTGIGIPQTERDRIFERFYRLDKSGNSKISGSGLGLTITKHMVEEFQGTIEVVSREGEGSTFRIRIPHEDPPLSP